MSLAMSDERTSDELNAAIDMPPMPIATLLLLPVLPLLTSARALLRAVGGASPEQMQFLFVE
jgi:hypothetical protein